MVDKIDMSLDEIIKSSKKEKQRALGDRGSGGARWDGYVGGGRAVAGAHRKRTSGNGGRRNRGGGIQKAKFARGDVNSAWKHNGPKRGDMFKTAGDLAQLVISNLDYGISDWDVQVLFEEFGPLKKVAVHYDRSGRSLGTADVVFEHRSNALKAMKKCNGLLIGGIREMNVQLAISDISVFTRVGRGNTGGGPPKRRGARRGEAANRKNGGGRGDRKGPVSTSEESDEEFNAYLNDLKI